MIAFFWYIRLDPIVGERANDDKFGAGISVRRIHQLRAR